MRLKKKGEGLSKLLGGGVEKGEKEAPLSPSIGLQALETSTSPSIGLQALEASPSPSISHQALDLTSPPFSFS